MIFFILILKFEQFSKYVTLDVFTLALICSRKSIGSFYFNFEFGQIKKYATFDVFTLVVTWNSIGGFIFILKFEQFKK